MTCPQCNATDGHVLGCPEAPAGAPAPMSKEDRADFARELRSKLASHRDVFVIDKFMFEPNGARRIISNSTAEGAVPLAGTDVSKSVSATTLKLLLDYCESDWDMDFVSYCAGIFHGREPLPSETAFDLLPDVQSRISGDRLGFGHIYGGEER